MAAPEENVHLSKALSWFLRHGVSWDLRQPGGFVDLQAVLNHPSFAKYSLHDIQTQVAKQTEYKRFEIRSHPDSGKLQIRANHFHSVEVQEPHWIPITQAGEIPATVFPTTFRQLKSLTFDGFCRQRDRTFIHFWIRDPSDEYKVLGGRHDVPTEIFIYIDVKKALADGLKFFRSEYNLVMTRGNSRGVLEPKYIDKVVDIRTGDTIFGNRNLELALETADRRNLVPITNANDVPRVVLPTIVQDWESYTSNGFRRMKNQTFIHFFLEDPNTEYKTFGAQCNSSADIFIYIDLKKALEDGLTFFRSEDDLVLTRGNSRCILEPKYIDKVVDIKAGKSLRFLIG